MSLRDFNAPFPNDPHALHNVPSGNGAGLQTFHTKQPEDIEPNNMPKIVGAVAVALMIGAAGIALYNSAGRSMQPKPVVTANNLPAPPAAPVPAQMTPDANMPAAPAADSMPAPAAPPVKEVSVPVPKKHKVASTDSMSTSSMKAAPAGESAASGASARMAADSTQSTVQPAQQQAITAPTPSPSDVASNNTQSGVGVSPNATSAADIPAPQPQEQQAQQPAPAQPPEQAAGQVNQ